MNGESTQANVPLSHENSMVSGLPRSHSYIYTDRMHVEITSLLKHPPAAKKNVITIQQRMQQDFAKSVNSVCAMKNNNTYKYHGRHLRYRYGIVRYFIGYIQRIASQEIWQYPAHAENVLPPAPEQLANAGRW